MEKGVFAKGQKIKLIAHPICCPELPIGREGEIIGVRHGTDLRLVKFQRKAGPVQVSTQEIQEA